MSVNKVSVAVFPVCDSFMCVAVFYVCDCLMCVAVLYFYSSSYVCDSIFVFSRRFHGQT